MLTKIETKNYRNLDLEDGVTLGPLNIFVGPNGSGKSNLIKVLKFIQDGLIGVPDPRRGVTSFESAVADFGAGRILDASIKPPSQVQLKFYFAADNKGVDVLDIELEVKDTNTAIISQESLYSLAANGLSQYFYQAHVPSVGGGYVALNINGKEYRVEISSLNNREFAFNDIVRRANMEQSNRARVLELKGGTYDELKNLPMVALTKGGVPISKQIEPLIRSQERLSQEIRGWGFYESSLLNIESIRHPRQEIGLIDQTLAPSGNNLIPVLSNLFRDHIDFEERTLDALRELFPQTRRLRVVAEGRTLAIQWFVNGIEEPFYIDQMSNGTIRMLCWAIVLLSPKKHDLIVIEEPENDLHPAWLRILAGWIRQAARESQVIVSTHSPDLLDYFTEDVDSVQTFKRSPNNPKNSTVAPLDRNALVPRLQEGWQIGDLYRVHDPSIGGWPW